MRRTEANPVIGPTFLTVGLTVGFALLLSTLPGRALCQEVGDLGDGYAAMVSFAAEPAIAGEAFDVDGDSETLTDTEVKALRIPVYREFGGEQSERRFFAQGALSAVRYSARYDLDLGEVLGPLSIKPEWTAYTATLQGGLVQPLSESLSLLAGLGAGYGRLENEARFSDEALGDLLLGVLPASLFDWESDAVIGRADLGLRDDRQFGNVRLKARADLVANYVESVNESSGFDGFTGTNYTLSFQVDLSRPLPLEPGGYPLFVLAGLGGFVLLGDSRDQLGFSELFEASLGIGYRQFALRFGGVFGADVQGFGISLDYGY